MHEFPPKPFALPQEQQRQATNAAHAVGTYLAHVPRVSVVELTPSLHEGPPLELSAGVLSLLQRVLEELGAGNAVTVAPYPSELSTQQAANILNVSRPYVVKLIEQGHLPYRKVGPRRRILLNDLLAYKDRDEQARYAAADELTREAERLGLGYTNDTSATSRRVS